MKAANDTPALVAEGLESRRSGRRLFTGLGFRLQAGQALQIAGPNGSGKTSLLRILSGLALAEAGALYWRGRDVNAQWAEYHGDIAYVGHANGVKGALTPRENLRFAGALAAERSSLTITAALETLGLDGLADTPCGRLSAGQRRRVALARLLVTDAPLWLLDEPLTALDSASVATLEGLLRGHLAAEGLLVVTTHRPLALDPYPIKQVALAA